MDEIVLADPKFALTPARFDFDSIDYDYLPPELVTAKNDFDKYFYENLTERQRHFLVAYFKTSDPRAAAIAAAIDIDPNEAGKKGVALASQPFMTEARMLWQRFKRAQKRYCYDVHKDDNYRFHQDVTDADPGDFFSVDDSGELRITIPDDLRKRRCIKELKQTTKQIGQGKNATTVTELSLKLHDPVVSSKFLEDVHGEKKITMRNAKGDQEIIAEKGKDGVYVPITYMIRSVPAGEFIPPPEPPMRTVEHLPV